MKMRSIGGRKRSSRDLFPMEELLLPLLLLLVLGREEEWPAMAVSLNLDSCNSAKDEENVRITWEVIGINGERFLLVSTSKFLKESNTDLVTFRFPLKPKP